MLPVAGIGYVVASIGIGALLFFAGRYRHREIGGVSIFRVAPPYFYFFVIFSTGIIVFIVFLSTAGFPEQSGGIGMLYLACGFLCVCVFMAWYARRLRIRLDDKSMTCSGLMTRRMLYTEIVKIINYTFSGQGFVYSMNKRRIWIFTVIEDHSNLMTTLKERCTNAEYIEQAK